jgi:Glycosyl transferase family 2
MPDRALDLDRAMRSVLGQDLFPDAIHIVTDKGDRSKELGGGVSEARNKGIMAATTTYVAFLDDDDELYPNHLATLVKVADTTGADLVYPWFDSAGATGKLAADLQELTDKMYGRPWGPKLAEMVRHSNHIPIATLVRTTRAQEVGGFPSWDESPRHPYPPYHPLEDWGFLLRLLDVGAVFHHVPERTWKKNEWGGNTTAQWQRDREKLA